MYGVPSIAASMEGCGKEHYADAAGFIATPDRSYRPLRHSLRDLSERQFPEPSSGSSRGRSNLPAKHRLVFRIRGKKDRSQGQGVLLAGLRRHPGGRRPRHGQHCRKGALYRNYTHQMRHDRLRGHGVAQRLEPGIRIKQSLNREHQALATYGPINSF